MKTIAQKYAEYVNYMNRNEAGRSVMTVEEFVEAHGLTDDAAIVLQGVCDPMHY
jgi:hypothetical protein